MTATRISKPLRAEWCGRLGESYSIHHDSSETGRRVIVHRWLDGSGAVDVKAMRGDGRNVDCVLFCELQLTNPTPEELAEAIAKASATLPAKGARVYPPRRYVIVRHFADGRAPRIVRMGLTFPFAEAADYCRAPHSRGDGWADSFEPWPPRQS